MIAQWGELTPNIIGFHCPETIYLKADMTRLQVFLFFLTEDYRYLGQEHMKFTVE